MSEDFDTKIAKLKAIHAYSDTSAQKSISEWAERMARLRVEKDWLDHPNAEELRTLATEQIDNIVSVLSNKKDLTDAERQGLLREKDVHFMYLGVLTADPESEMKVIESQVTEELP